MQIIRLRSIALNRYDLDLIRPDPKEGTSSASLEGPLHGVMIADRGERVSSEYVSGRRQEADRPRLMLALADIQPEVDIDLALVVHVPLPSRHFPVSLRHQRAGIHGARPGSSSASSQH